MAVVVLRSVSRSVGVLCVGLVASLGLVACSGEAPAPEPSQSAAVKESKAPESPSPTSTPTQEQSSPAPTGPPKMPKDARRGNDFGASKFALHFLDLYNYEADTGDWAPLKATFDDSCDVCKNIPLEPPLEYKGGHWIKLDTPSVLVDEDPYFAQVDIRVKTEEGSYVIPTPGAKRVPMLPGKWKMVTYLEWKGDRWVVLDFAQKTS